MTDVHTELNEAARVGVVELRRPPNNFLDAFTLRAIADAFEAFDANPDCRCILLRSEGKHFCAGRDVSAPRAPGDSSIEVYRQAVRLVRVGTPSIAAVQGGAIGAGLGLALTADFRVAGPRAYFAANFVTLGIHHGFGLTVTLPAVVGAQAARDMLYTGRKISAPEAASMRLVDRLVDENSVAREAWAFATLIASNSAEAVRSIRQTMRETMADEFAAAVENEARQQAALQPPLASPPG